MTKDEFERKMLELGYTSEQVNEVSALIEKVDDPIIGRNSIRVMALYIAKMTREYPDLYNFVKEEWDV